MKMLITELLNKTRCSPNIQTSFIAFKYVRENEFMLKLVAIKTYLLFCSKKPRHKEVK
jgi:hypothetical protein